MSRISHKIPLNKQDVKAIGGLDVGHIVYKEGLKHTHILGDHRDDYYILMICMKGSGTMQCDMEQVVFGANSIMLIRPYQVHSAKAISENAEGYFISIAPFLMPEHCNNVFQYLPVSKQYTTLSATVKKQLVDTVSLLHQAFTEENSHKRFIIHSLFNALINRVTAIFSAAEEKSVAPQKQSQQITQKFMQLVSEHSFRHSPSFFSEKLAVTTSHLNDCVRSVTGGSVTNYLQDAMLLEAKRNLYYTNDDVKTIAFTLGFEDHTYFSRLFKKLTDETPLSFRKKFRE